MWWHFTVSKVGVRDNGSKWADVSVTEVVAPEYDAKNIRQIEDWLYDIPSAGCIWEGWIHSHNRATAINQVEYKILNWPP